MVESVGKEMSKLLQQFLLPNASPAIVVIAGAMVRLFVRASSCNRVYFQTPATENTTYVEQYEQTQRELLRVQTMLREKEQQQKLIDEEELPTTTLSSQEKQKVCCKSIDFQQSSLRQTADLISMLRREEASLEESLVKIEKRQQALLYNEYRMNMSLVVPNLVRLLRQNYTHVLWMMQVRFRIIISSPFLYYSLLLTTSKSDNRWNRI